uniref:Late cornified envelope 5A n=1 Tax=Macaca nemestrina TaxID=9545 RepID=A0A2K6C8T7_MACNE
MSLCPANQAAGQPPPKCSNSFPKCPQCPAPCSLQSLPAVVPSFWGCCSSGVVAVCVSHHRPRLFHRRRHQSPDCCESEPSGGSGCCHSSGSCC